MSNTPYRAKVLSKRPTPNYANLDRLLSLGTPSRPTLFEFFLNPELDAVLAGPPANPEATPLDSVRRRVACYHKAGYDYATHHASKFAFPTVAQDHGSTLSLNEGVVIHDRKDFETLQWMEPDSCDYSCCETIQKELPDGMKTIAFGPGGVLENVVRMLGYENLCVLLMDDPELTQEVFDAIGSRLVRHYEICASFDSVAACISNDDWGFKSQPMLSPSDLRKYVFPWHKRIVEAIHAAGKKAILHSCGNASEIMDDIIDGMGYDGKHSYEDIIEPVEDAYGKYAGRIAILGGVDLDFICRRTADEVYVRAKKMLDLSKAKGCYALGTGNSVPAYVPMENYFAMIWAAIESRA